MNLQEMKNLPPDKQKQLYERLNLVRKKAKTVSYSAMYGVGKLKLSRSSGIPAEEADKLLKAFWKINKSVVEVSSVLEVRTIRGQMWVKNPVNNFWYSLRYDKDKWSTLNQGTGAYCFDTWLAFCMSKGVVPCGQFHDEFVTAIDEGDRQWCNDTLLWAISKTNEKLKLNVDLGIDIQFGNKYSEIH